VRGREGGAGGEGTHGRGGVGSGCRSRKGFLDPTGRFVEFYGETKAFIAIFPAYQSIPALASNSPIPPPIQKELNILLLQRLIFIPTRKNHTQSALGFPLLRVFSPLQRVARQAGNIPILRNDLISKTLDLVDPWVPPLGVAGDRATILFLLEFTTHFGGRRVLSCVAS